MGYHSNQHHQCSSLRQPSSLLTVAHCLPELTDLTTSIAVAAVVATGKSNADGVTTTTATTYDYNWHDSINFVLFASFRSEELHFVARINAANRPVVWQGGRFGPIREAAQGWAPALMWTIRTAECVQRFAFREHHFNEDGYDAA